MARKPKPHPPWSPADFTREEAYAAKAFDNGEATPDQQLRLKEWLLRVTHLREELFVPDRPDVTNYRLGRRSVGLQYAVLVKWRPPNQGE